MATVRMWRYPEGVRTDRNLSGYEVEASDGPIGSIDEATKAVDEYWVIVDTGPWIFGKRVLLPAGPVERVDHGDERVFVNRSREEIKNAPEYDVSAGASGPYRQELGTYYTASSTHSGRSRSSSRSRSGSSAKSRERRSSRSRTSDEPTKEELYAQAKRLGIPGRSKMDKAQLKRALSRASRSAGTTPGRARSGRSRGKASPVEVQSFLEGVSYPTRRGDLLRAAESSGAGPKVRDALARLPEQRFENPTEVSEAVGKRS
jgi:hypothetical protein